jgi:hypothetical protein
VISCRLRLEVPRRKCEDWEIEMKSGIFRFNRTRRRGGLEMVLKKGGLGKVEVEGELSLKWTL